MEERTLVDYWLVLYRRKVTLALTVLSAIGLSLYLSAVLPPIYEAKAVVLVPKEPDVVTFFSPDASKSIAPKPSIPPTKKEENSPYIGLLRSVSVRRKVQEVYPQKSLLELKLDTDFNLNREFGIEIFVRDEDPQLAADLVNAHIKAFNELFAAISNDAEGVQATIEKQLAETRGRLEDARRALQDFQERERIADLSQETAELVRQRFTFEVKIEDAKVDLKGIEQRIAGVQRQLQREASYYVPSELVTTSPLVDSLKKDLTDLEAAISGGLSEQTARHPSITRLQAQYDEKKRELEKEIKTIIDSKTKAAGSFHETLRQSLVNLFVDKIVLEAQSAALGRTVAGIASRLTRLPEIKAKHDELVSELNLNQKLVDGLSTNLEEVRTQAKRYVRWAVVVDPALPPESPIFPLMWLNVPVAAMLGLIGGILYCFFLDFIERALDSRRTNMSLSSPAAAILLRRS